MRRTFDPNKQVNYIHTPSEQSTLAGLVAGSAQLRSCAGQSVFPVISSTNCTDRHVNPRIPTDGLLQEPVRQSAKCEIPAKEGMLLRALQRRKVSQRDNPALGLCNLHLNRRHNATLDSPALSLASRTS